MGNIVTNTADILAIVGGATTFAVAIFASIKMSRCKKVTCCWDGCVLVNEPPKDRNGVTPPPNTPKSLTPSLSGCLAPSDSELDLGVGVVM